MKPIVKPSKLTNVSWPRIALVTPVFNSGKYIEQTILSVLGQDYPNLEYFIVDGGSTDETIEVIRKYEDQISGWMSEPDNGMYDAINKGFARTSGEVMGWISATDMLHPGGLRVVGSIFRMFREVEWITGRPTNLNEEGMTIYIGPVPRWSRSRFLAGANRYIQQESTFWRRSLWEKAGGQVDATRRYAMDFELWVRFFRHAKLYSVDALIGGFRMHDASLGLQDLAKCHDIQAAVIKAELGQVPWGGMVKFAQEVNNRIREIPVVRFAWWHLLERPVQLCLSGLPGPDWPPVIRYEMFKGYWYVE